MTTPLFKKKNVRGTRRKRENSELEDRESSSLYSIKKENEDLSLNASKWARYASLQKDEPQIINGENDEGVNAAETLNFGSSESTAINVAQSQIHDLDIEDEEDMPQVAPDYEILTKDIDQDSNHAFTTVTMSNLKQFVTPSKSETASSFTLKESYFRDAPMDSVSHDKEYADKFGNVSDDEITQAKVDAMQSDDDVEIMDEFAGPNLAKHNSFYDMEVSVDEDLDVENGKIPNIETLKNDITERIQKLQNSIRLRSERLPQVERSLEEADEKRLKLLKRLEAL